MSQRFGLVAAAAALIAPDSILPSSTIVPGLCSDLSANMPPR